MRAITSFALFSTTATKHSIEGCLSLLSCQCVERVEPERKPVVLELGSPLLARRSALEVGIFRLAVRRIKSQIKAPKPPSSMISLSSSPFPKQPEIRTSTWKNSGCRLDSICLRHSRRECFQVATETDYQEVRL